MSPVAEFKRIRRRQALPSRSDLVRLSLLAFFTAVYFADVLLRASAKSFWYDEILTVYFAALPNLHTLWSALQTGIESNPPTFHLMTKAAQAIFGRGLVGTRMPEIVSFWIMSLCLFKFVERRAGIIAGYIAMTLPMLTGVYYYAYEARPLIMVAAFGAVALICWDNAKRSTGRKRWLVAFSFALLAALLLHAYAVLLLIPFGFTELIRTLRLRRIDWPFWLALTLPLVPASALYIPLFEAFRAFTKGTQFVADRPPNVTQLVEFYSYLLKPCLPIALVGFTVAALQPRLARFDSEARIRSDWDDLSLCLGFVCLPIFGLFLSDIVHNPYFGRYFLSAIIGISIVFSVIWSSAYSQSRAATAVAVLISFLLLINLGRIARHRAEGTGEVLVEPSSTLIIESTPKRPLSLYGLITKRAKGQAPIAVLNPLEFLYLVNYAPELRSRLHFVYASDSESVHRGLRDFLRWSPVKYNAPEAGKDFTRSFPEYYVYGSIDEQQVFGILSRSGHIQSFQSAGDHFLARVTAGSLFSAPAGY